MQVVGFVRGVWKRHRLTAAKAFLALTVGSALYNAVPELASVSVSSLELSNVATVVVYFVAMFMAWGRFRAEVLRADLVSSGQGNAEVVSLYDEGIATAELLFSFRRYVRYMLIYVAGPVVIMMLVLPLFAGGLE